jgi:hypothetical protein
MNNHNNAGCEDFAGCYQRNCEDYALYGDPMRDHYDYEEAARYDRYDGWGDPDPCYESAYEDWCPVCGDQADCVGCLASRLAYSAWRVSRIAQDMLYYPDRNDNVPF